jgi:magnesium chelatase subunit I
LRRQIVATRLEFDSEPQSFRARFASEQKTLQKNIADARTRLASVTWNDDILDQISQRCIDARVDGLRADLIMLRAARALAALQNSAKIESAHVNDVAELVLHHRRNAMLDQSHSGSNAQAQTPSPNPSPAAQNNWGELPPEAVAIQPVKQVKPLPVKKP